jgi:hypothetical protein
VHVPDVQQGWSDSFGDLPISAAEYLAQLAGTENLWWACAYTSMFASIREHRWDHVSTEVRHVT